MCEVIWGQAKERSHTGGAVPLRYERLQSRRLIHPRFYGYAVDANTGRFFFFPLGSSQSRRVETVAALQVGRTPAAAFYQSQRQPLPGAQRRDGLQFSNLMVQDNLKVFPQVGSHLQYELGRRQQASRVGFMNSFKSSC